MLGYVNGKDIEVKIKSLTITRTKSWICAVFMVCFAILYPGIALGIVSGTGNQARMVIKQKIASELIQNENIRREIDGDIRTGSDDCVVHFKNGSSIRAISLGVDKKGDNARGKVIATLYRNVFIKRRRIAGNSQRCFDYNVRPQMV